MELYREVKCSDRLPKKDGLYWTNLGRTYFQLERPGSKIGSDGEFDVDDGHVVTFWLEELPQEEILNLLKGE